MNSRFFQFIRVISLLAVFWLACGVNAEESPLSKISKDDWPNWRGPQQTGIVNPEQDPPSLVSAGPSDVVCVGGGSPMDSAQGSVHPFST